MFAEKFGCTDKLEEEFAKLKLKIADNKALLSKYKKEKVLTPNLVLSLYRKRPNTSTTHDLLDNMKSLGLVFGSQMKFIRELLNQSTLLSNHIKDYVSKNEFLMNSL